MTTNVTKSLTGRLPLRLTLAGFTTLPGVLTGRYRLRILPLALIGPLASALVVYLGFAGYLYPLRPDALAAMDDPHGFDNSWGGPTLVGAWAVHALIALAVQLPCFWLLRTLSRRRNPAPVS
jgi:hypothetical protein